MISILVVDDLEVIRRLGDNVQVTLRAEIMILTQYDNLFFVREAFITGAAGFLTKSDVPAELVIAVREVFAKRSFVSKSIFSPTHDPPPANP